MSVQPWCRGRLGEVNGVVEADDEVVGEDFSEDAGRPAPEVASTGAVYAEPLDELAERGFDAATQPHGQAYPLWRPPVHHVPAQRGHQRDATFGEIRAELGRDQPFVGEDERAAP